MSESIIRRTLSLSPPQRPLCATRRLGTGDKEARRALTFFTFSFGMTGGSLCGGESGVRLPRDQISITSIFFQWCWNIEHMSVRFVFKNQNGQPPCCYCAECGWDFCSTIVEVNLINRFPLRKWTAVAAAFF